MKKLLVAVLLLLVFAMSGCVPTAQPEIPQPEVVGGEKSATLKLSAETMTVNVGQTVYLPTAVAEDGQGNDVTSRVMVEVLSPDGTQYIPEIPYFPMTFSAVESGNYVARYTIYGDNSSVVTRKYAVITSRENTVAEGFVIDGVLNETQYSEMPSYIGGLNSNVVVESYFDDNGVYLGVNVKDSNLIYNDYVAGRFTQTDGFALYMDFANGSSVLLNNLCYKLEVNVNGGVWISKAKQSKVGFELQESLQPQYRLQLHGTKTAVDSSDLKPYRDEDEGYTFEVYLPYSVLGVTAKPQQVGFALSHRDVSSMYSDEIKDGSQYNMCYDEVQLPKDMTQEVFDNGNNYTLQWYDAYSLTALYNTLYVEGNKGIATTQVEPQTTVDGQATDEIYNNATEVSAGQATVKAVSDSNGVYIFATTNSDSLTVAIASTAQHSSTQLGNDYKQDGKRIELVGGSVYISALSQSANKFVMGMDRQIALRQSDGTVYIEMFIPHYEIGQGSWFVCVGDGDVFSCNIDNPSLYTAIAEVNS